MSVVGLKYVIRACERLYVYSRCSYFHVTDCFNVVMFLHPLLIWSLFRSFECSTSRQCAFWCL